MSSYSSNMLKPLVDRDIIAPEHTMGIPAGMGMMNNPYLTNYLGGVSMRPGLSQDTYMTTLNENNKNTSNFKKALGIIAGITVFCALRGKGEKLGKWFKGLFKFGKNKNTP